MADQAAWVDGSRRDPAVRSRARRNERSRRSRTAPRPQRRAYCDGHFRQPGGEMRWRRWTFLKLQLAHFEWTFDSRYSDANLSLPAFFRIKSLKRCRATTSIITLGVSVWDFATDVFSGLVG